MPNARWTICARNSATPPSSGESPMRGLRRTRRKSDTTHRHSGAMRSIEPGISRFRVRANARPGMTGCRPSLARLGILDLELAHRAGNDEVIVVEHQRAGDAVLEQFER